MMEFKSLYTDHLDVSETNSRHHLKLLLNDGIVRKEKEKGTKAMYLRVSPIFIERARKYFGVQQKQAYIGMVGDKSPEAQINEAIKRIRSNNWLAEIIIVFTTQETIKVLEQTGTWKGILETHPGSSLIVTPLIDIAKTLETMKSVIDELVYQYSAVADVTGLTKLHTLALYNLAKEYNLERIYLPKDEDRVVYLP